MKQNKYDDPGFFANYSQMARSVGGLEAAGEWQSFRPMLPELAGKRVLDIGCGFGWHCRYAREQGAASVVGIDISENMLARAREMTDDPAITYRRLAIEDLDYPDAAFDVVVSSLALHYIERFDDVCRTVHRLLGAGGSFVFSVEHPVFTSRAAQDWHYGPGGEKLHWPVDRYYEEGLREARFLENDVIKYHRTVSTMLNALIEAGFRIRKLSEPQPAAELLAKSPVMRDELRRPLFLMAAADRLD
ncbi:Methyltransferase domain-containing protein [Paenibacillus sp. UNC496MF]|uniref:class I SAM-dependent methyltransferase n=1 Tax=Paenibacillus sp. UNC496MF TaxID=1502753 RepID=UPI0008EF6A69|nr:class I SAM-dependent methyltransferase [Paenibacillus sp. UNC496MF]SFJ68543.1 Methyltransferase domain-containing protein [Paenibacillus sp. UNC496MF]